MSTDPANDHQGQQRACPDCTSRPDIRPQSYPPSQNFKNLLATRGSTFSAGLFAGQSIVVTGDGDGGGGGNGRCNGDIDDLKLGIAVVNLR